MWEVRYMQINLIYWILRILMYSYWLIMGCWLNSALRRRHKPHKSRLASIRNMLALFSHWNSRYRVKTTKGFLPELDDVVSAQESHVIFWLLVNLGQLQVVLAIVLAFLVPAKLGDFLFSPVVFFVVVLFVLLKLRIKSRAIPHNLAYLWARDTGVTLDNVIFTDECSVSAEQYRRTCYRKIDEPQKRKPKPKHPLKVHVWAGISKHGPTKISIFDGIMDAELYCEILEGSF